jgi:hypothetical protein
MEREFGSALLAPALEAVARFEENGLLVFDGRTVRLTARGQLLSNEVFQEFLGLDDYLKRGAISVGQRAASRSQAASSGSTVTSR